MTKAQKFIKKAKEIMPHIEDLQDLDTSIDDPSHIDEIMFHRSEYIGGMAQVILELVNMESK